MKTKKLYLFKCHDNRSWAGAVPVYFSNAAEARKFGKYDYVSYCGIENMKTNMKSGYPVAVYQKAEDVDEDNFVYAWGITDSGKLWKYGEAEK